MLKPETYRHPEPKRRLPLPPEIEGSIWHKSAARCTCAGLKYCPRHDSYAYSRFGAKRRNDGLGAAA